MLNYAVFDDVFKDRISCAIDGYDNGFGLRGYPPEVVSKGEDRPVVIDGAEVSILAAVESTVRDE